MKHLNRKPYIIKSEVFIEGNSIIYKLSGDKHKIIVKNKNNAVIVNDGRPLEKINGKWVYTKYIQKGVKNG